MNPPAPLLLLVDAHALLHRAYHALPPTMTTADGFPTNALYGFALTTLRAIEQFRPTHVAVCFDERPTRREEIFVDYKAHRPAAEDDLVKQLIRARDIPAALGIRSFAGDGHEADDYLGTLATMGRSAGMRVIILSGDKDTYQLVDDAVSVCTLKTGLRDTVLVTPRVVEDSMGLRPDQMIDYKALRGDPSDNIPGIPGIGDVTARKLLQKYQTLDGLYAALPTAADIKGKLRERLETQRALAETSRTLATIRCDIPLDTTVDALQFTPDIPAATKLFASMDFRTLLPLLGRIGGTERTAAPAPRAARAALPREAEQASLFAPAEAAGATASSPSREHAESTFEHRIVRTEEDLARMVDDLSRAELLAVDTETPSLDALRALPCGISLAASTEYGYYVNLGHDGEKLSREQVQRALHPILGSPRVTKVAQNLKFDYQVLQNAGLRIVRGEDTLLMAYLLAPGARSLGLDTLVREEFGYAMQPITELIGKGKQQIPFDAVPLESAARYSVEDAVFTLRLYHRLRERLAHGGQWALLERFEFPLVPILAKMERRGILVDAEQLAMFGAELQEQLAATEEKIVSLVGHPFNLNSPKQVQEVLFQELQIPTRGLRATASGGVSTAAEELEKIDHPVAEQLLAFRELEKLRSTYVDAIPQLRDDAGRVHTSYNQAVAATGRLSSSDPNLQNIPVRTEYGRRIRAAFVAAPGHVLLAADYSQIELRVLAHLSGDPHLTTVYREGRDIHAQTAAFLFSVDPGAVTKEQRSAAKTVNFGILYGMGPRRLARENKIPLAEATKFIEGYFASYPRVSAWMDETLAAAKERGYVETSFGRRRYLPELQSGRGMLAAQAERMAVNHPIQGTAADLMKLAMIAVDRALDGRTDAHMLLQVHDELVLEVEERVAEEVAALLRSQMESVAAFAVPLTVEVSSGRSWGALRTMH